jgi:hypothetical protein
MNCLLPLWREISEVSACQPTGMNLDIPKRGATFLLKLLR